MHTNSRLISPSITLSPVSGDEELSLQFWHWFSFYFSNGERTQISVYDSTSGIWTDWQTIGSTIMQSSGVWSYHGVDITSYAGKKVRIAFYYQGDGGPGWYIDDVEIAGISTEPTPTPTPTPSPSPTPTITPTPILTPCEPENITADQKTVEVIVDAITPETITITCGDGTPSEGRLVTWKIKEGKKNISITPESATTDGSGQAIFSITGEKNGKVKVDFKDKKAGLKTRVKVEVSE